MNHFDRYKEPTLKLVLHLLHEAYKDEDKIDKILKEFSEEVIAELTKEVNKLVKDGKLDLNNTIDLDNNPALYGALKRIETLQWHRFTEYCWLISQMMKESLIRSYKETVITTYQIFGKIEYVPEFQQTPKWYLPPVQITDTYIIEKVLNVPWCSDGKVYSERLYKNVSQFYRKLNYVLEQGISKGKGMDWMIASWRKLTGSSAYDAARLLKTETMAMWSRATKESYLAMGIEYVEIVGDAECGGVCLDYVGEAVPLAEAELGDLLPPYHPNCACSYIAYEEEKE